MTPGLNFEKFARVSKKGSFHFQSGSLSARRQNNEMFSFNRRKPPVSALGTGISFAHMFYPTTAASGLFKKFLHFLATK